MENREHTEPGRSIPGRKETAMTKKRFKKLSRALFTKLHEYSKLVEGEIGYNGEPLKRTRMIRKNVDMTPNWDAVGSYEECWQMLLPVWESVNENLRRMKAE